MKTPLFDSPTTTEKDHPIGGGKQRIYRFPNGYGASVVRFPLNPLNPFLKSFPVHTTYGSHTDNENEWELAVIKFKEKSNRGFKLWHNNPIIKNDIIGHLLQKDVEKLLKQIKALSKEKMALIQLKK